MQHAATCYTMWQHAACTFPVTPSDPHLFMCTASTDVVKCMSWMTRCDEVLRSVRRLGVSAGCSPAHGMYHAALGAFAATVASP